MVGGKRKGRWIERGRMERREGRRGKERGYSERRRRKKGDGGRGEDEIEE